MIRLRKYVLLVFLSLVAWYSVKGQNIHIQPDSLISKAASVANTILAFDVDSGYIKSYRDKLAVQANAINRGNYFVLNDKSSDSKLRYRPTRNLSLGFGVAYQWFAVNFNFDTGPLQENELDNSRNTNIGIQLFTNKHYITSYLDYQLGYKIVEKSGDGIDFDENVRLREDVRFFRFGLSYLYAINKGKFSLRAPFIRTEAQRKSAGSVLAGVSFEILSLGADTSMVPAEVTDSYNPKLGFNDLLVTELAFSLGYMFTLAIHEHWYITMSAIPAIDLSFGDYVVENRRLLDRQVGLQISSINALGYNGPRFFGGISLDLSYNTIRLGSEEQIQMGFSELRLSFGYRFKSGKK